ncbi:bifunctional pyr operon transcriptional regulator/uracil phosphoribosyltransferase PyrR [Candidatus Margulisiibacteriota bacterium]
MVERVIMNAAEISRALSRIATQIIEANKGAKNVVLVGVLERGAPLAERLSKLIGDIEKTKVPFGSMDVSMHRDDLAEKGKEIEVRRSELQFSVDDKVVVLVDDVIFAGRTVRAAMDSLNDYGRPSKIQLAVLVDRGGRDLPIHPDFVGKQITASKTDKVMVNLKETDGADKVIVK